MQALGFPGGSAVKNPPTMQEIRVWSLGWEDHLGKGLATRSGILAWRIPTDREAWQATVAKSLPMGLQRVGHN